MRCPNCSTENPAEARFCQNCGAVLDEGGHETQVLPPAAPPGRGPAPGTTPYSVGAGPGTADEVGPPMSLEGVDRRPPSRYRAALAGGWVKALGAAAITFLVTVLIGQGLAALAYAASDEPPSIGDVFKIGGLLTFAVHRVGVRASFPDFSLPTDGVGVPGGGVPGGSISISITVALALLLGTAVVVWLLWRTGRSLGVESGGPAWVRGLAGAKVALPYALIVGLAALAFSAFPLSFRFPAIAGFTGGGDIELAPSVVAAFLWPLAIGLIAGFAGGATSAPASSWEASPSERFLVGALRGGGVALGLAVLLGFVGVQIVAFANPDTAFPFNPAFFSEAFSENALAGTATTVYALFLAPNLGALAAAASMGVPLGAQMSGVEVTLLSLTRFPESFNPEALAGLGGIPSLGGPGDLIDYRLAPAVYWLFLLVPLIAVLIGGRAAARRRGADTTGEGAAAGALAGIVYALLVTVLAVAAGVGLRSSGGFAGLAQTQSGQVGASVVATVLLGLAWGLVVGAAGGALGVRRQAAHAPVAPAGPAGFAEPSEAAPQEPEQREGPGE